MDLSARQTFRPGPIHPPTHRHTQLQTTADKHWGQGQTQAECPDPFRWNAKHGTCLAPLGAFVECRTRRGRQTSWSPPVAIHTHFVRETNEPTTRGPVWMIWSTAGQGHGANASKHLARPIKTKTETLFEERRLSAAEKCWCCPAVHTHTLSLSLSRARADDARQPKPSAAEATQALVGRRVSSGH